MIDIEKLSKSTVYDIMLQQVLVLNWWGMKLEELVRPNHPELLASQEYMRVNEECGLREANGLARVLDLAGNGIDSLTRLLQYSHWALFENVEIGRLTEVSCRMRIVDCSAQRAAKKNGIEHYECAGLTRAYLRGFCNHVNQKMNIQQVFAPPGVRPKGIPENVSCEWVFTMEGTN